jgi:hypothetical protein
MIRSTQKNWHRIDEAPKGAGPLLCRAGSGPSDPAYVGYQNPSTGRWFSGDAEVHPTHYCEIPLFDADDEGATS